MPGYKVIYYKGNSGREPVREFLLNLKDSGNRDDRKLFDKIMTYIELLEEQGTSLGMPYVKHLEGDLWELRPKGVRIVFTICGNQIIVLLSSFEKTTQKTPRNELRLARQRLKNLIEK
jgi:phage-related protein